jgi:hypothetical protein
MRYLKCSLALLLACNFFFSAQAATVTVGTAQTPYTTLKAAIDNLSAGNNWGDGNDTILLEDPVYFEGGRSLVQPKNNGSLTIKGTAANPHPKFVLLAAKFNNASSTRSLMRIDGLGTTTLDGLVIIGSPGADILLQEGVIDVDLNAATEIPASADQIARVIIRNCLFSANDGSNAPVTDWSQTPTTGRIDQYIRRGSDTLRGGMDLLIDNCTFAFAARGTGAKSGAVFHQTRATTLLPTTFQTTQSLTVRHCFFVKNTLASNFAAIQLGEQRQIKTGGMNMGPPEVHIEESAFVHAASGTVIRVDRNNSVNLSHITLRHCISLNTAGGRFFSTTQTDTGTTFKLAELTLHHPSSIPIQTSGSWGPVSFTVSDVILTPFPVGGSGGLYSDDNVTTMPSALTVSAIAANPACASVSSTASQAIFDASNPVTDDPQFTSTALDSSDNGRIGWDSTDNTLFDVGNMAYVGKGSAGLHPGNTLAGGAEPAPGVPVELSQFSVF